MRISNIVGRCMQPCLLEGYYNHLVSLLEGESNTEDKSGIQVHSGDNQLFVYEFNSAYQKDVDTVINSFISDNEDYVSVRKQSKPGVISLSMESEIPIADAGEVVEKLKQSSYEVKKLGRRLDDIAEFEPIGIVQMLKSNQSAVRYGVITATNGRVPADEMDKLSDTSRKCACSICGANHDKNSVIALKVWDKSGNPISDINGLYTWMIGSTCQSIMGLTGAFSKMNKLAEKINNMEAELIYKTSGNLVINKTEEAEDLSKPDVDDKMDVYGKVNVSDKDFINKANEFISEAFKMYSKGNGVWCAEVRDAVKNAPSSKVSNKIYNRMMSVWNANAISYFQKYKLTDTSSINAKNVSCAVGLKMRTGCQLPKNAMEYINSHGGIKRFMGHALHTFLANHDKSVRVAFLPYKQEMLAESPFCIKPWKGRAHFRGIIVGKQSNAYIAIVRKTNKDISDIYKIVIKSHSKYPIGYATTFTGEFGGVTNGMVLLSKDMDYSALRNSSSYGTTETATCDLMPGDKVKDEILIVIKKKALVSPEGKERRFLLCQNSDGIKVSMYFSKNHNLKPVIKVYNELRNDEKRRGIIWCLVVDATVDKNHGDGYVEYKDVVIKDSFLDNENANALDQTIYHNNNYTYQNR